MDEAIQQELLRRIKTSIGHLKGVHKMVEQDTFPPRTVVQLRAIRSALLKVEEQLIEQHLHACLSRSGSDSEAKILDDILKLWNQFP